MTYKRQFLFAISFILVVNILIYILIYCCSEYTIAKLDKWKHLHYRTKRNDKDLLRGKYIYSKSTKYLYDDNQLILGVI